MARRAPLTSSSVHFCFLVHFVLQLSAGSRFSINIPIATVLAGCYCPMTTWCFCTLFVPFNIIYFCFKNHLFGIFVQSHTMNRGSRVLCLVLQNLVILVNLFRGLNTLRPNQGPQSFSRDQKRFFKLVLHCQGQIRTSCKNCKTTQNIFNSLFGHGHVKMPFGVTHASYPYQSVSFNLINSSKTKTF